ncbi:hypothetical protein [Lewinella sp. IMCC34183]|uniref:hypothetical protein n=1 Tax=Lewinella sp. IMCC34183 TaxID=2248762 RepID=UPI000E265EAC|nr:hypothetical protein [Lewinella sp. IMCC34183]
MKSFYLLVTALLLGASLTGQATLRGLFVNLDGHAATLRYEDNDWTAGTRGYGFGVKLGYGIGTTTLYLGTGMTYLEGNVDTRFGEKYSLRDTELGARFHLTSNPRRVVPYVETAARYVTSEPYTGVSTRGGGAALAPGLLVYLSEHVALDARARIAGTYVYDVESVGIDLPFPTDPYSYVTAGFHLGVTFYPAVRRARYRFERGGGHL